LPEAATTAAVRAFLDWAGAAIAGSVEPPARVLATALAPADAGGGSRLVGGRRRVETSVAALVNGTASHTLEVDDIYAPGLFHPGAPVIAAALAIADRERASGQELLRAVVVGYEVGDRVAADLGPAHYRHWHSTATVGAIAAAAAGAELLGCDEHRFGHAVGLAATMAGGLQQTLRGNAMGKPLHAGHAAQAGVVAALAAHGGLTGALDALDGEAGLGAATGGVPAWVHSRAEFGPELLIEQTSVKPYPCCGHAFAAIDGALQLRAGGVRAADVAEIEVRTYRAAITVAGAPKPATVPEARFSIPFAVACALRDGTVGMASFTDDALSDPELIVLMQKVILRAGPDFDERFPARRGAQVTIIDAAGVRHAVSAPDRSGSPQNPVSDEQLKGKFYDLAVPVLGRAGAGTAAQSIRSMSHTPDVAAIMLG